MDFWTEYFGEHDIEFEGSYERFGKKVIGLKDPEGLQFELVFDSAIDDIPGCHRKIDNIGVPENYSYKIVSIFSIT
jgi:catechol 2,3-dioxygenase-like lactoylglutathione lyase family enzyme